MIKLLIIKSQHCSLGVNYFVKTAQNLKCKFVKLINIDKNNSCAEHMYTIFWLKQDFIGYITHTYFTF